LFDDSASNPFLSSATCFLVIVLPIGSPPVSHFKN